MINKTHGCSPQKNSVPSQVASNSIYQTGESKKEGSNEGSMRASVNQARGQKGAGIVGDCARQFFDLPRTSPARKHPLRASRSSPLDFSKANLASVIGLLSVRKSAHVRAQSCAGTGLKMPPHTNAGQVRSVTADLFSFSDRSASDDLKTLESDSSIGSFIGLTVLENRMKDVKVCQRVGLADSTTGAHVAMTHEGDSVFMVKSNSECLFELLGNCVAEMLQLNIPGFALVGNDSDQQARFKSMLKTSNDFPCMVTEFKLAVNLKEVTPGSMLLSDNLFHVLGRTFLMDLAIGNWDRFPVFENDTEGNYGNVMYEPAEKRLLIIDTVAQKHTELGGYGSDSYLDLSDQSLVNACKKIKLWLAPKFPALMASDDAVLSREFKAGVVDALKMLSAKKDELDDLFSYQENQLKAHKLKINETVPGLLTKLDKAISTEIQTRSQLARQSTHASLDDVLVTLRHSKDFNDSDKKQLASRLQSGRGIPRIGALGAKVKNSEAFMAAWNSYAQGSHRTESVAILKTLGEKLKGDLARIDLEDIINRLHSASFQDAALTAIVQVQEMRNEIHLQEEKLASVRDVFEKLRTSDGDSR